MSERAAKTRGSRSKKSEKAETEDDGGAWMNEGAKVAEFLLRFTSEPEAEAPLKNMVMISSPSTGGLDKNTLRMVSKQFKDDAEEGSNSIRWEGPGVNDDKAYKPISLMNILAMRGRDGKFKDRLPNLKSIDCYGLDTLMDLNGCPIGLEVLSCNGCNLIQSLAPLLPAPTYASWIFAATKSPASSH